MIYVTIGLVVGIIMGLTGAGGALISIPLFLSLLDASLKEATVLSLVAVVFGTSVNLFGKLKAVDNKIALPLSAAGMAGNYLSLPLKTQTPDALIAGLLTVIGIFSIFSVWKQKKNQKASHKEDKIIVKAVGTGILLGFITTLTGLGGGVIIVPLLIRLFGKSFEEALPTSLATILLISLTAFLFQVKTALTLISISQLGLIAGGTILSFALLNGLMRKLDESKILFTRRIVFTMVTVYSVINVVMKTL